MTNEEKQKALAQAQKMMSRAANDKRGVRWERDLRRAISNYGYIPHSMVGMFTIVGGDGHTYSLGIKSLMGGDDLHVVERMLDDPDFAAEHIRSVANLFGCNLAAQVREINSFGELARSLNPAFDEVVDEAFRAGMESVGDCPISEFVNALRRQRDQED